MTCDTCTAPLRHSVWSPCIRTFSRVAVAPVTLGAHRGPCVSTVVDKEGARHRRFETWRSPNEHSTVGGGGLLIHRRDSLKRSRVRLLLSVTFIRSGPRVRRATMLGARYGAPPARLRPPPPSHHAHHHHPPRRRTSEGGRASSGAATTLPPLPPLRAGPSASAPARPLVAAAAPCCIDTTRRRRWRWFQARCDGRHGHPP